ncbi:MAG: hypothetical protein LC798_13585 [Chloroflexi bacterium]|nr:hypothetical protein [Chloroflexota bacterium]
MSMIEPCRCDAPTLGRDITVGSVGRTSPAPRQYECGTCKGLIDATTPERFLKVELEYRDLAKRAIAAFCGEGAGKEDSA